MLKLNAKVVSVEKGMTLDLAVHMPKHKKKKACSDKNDYLSFPFLLSVLAKERFLQWNLV